MGCSWDVLSLDGDNIVAVSSSPVDVPHIKYGLLDDKESKSTAWNWLDVPSPTIECSEKVKSLLSSLKFSILKIPVRDVSDSLTKGARKPFEATFVSSKTKRSDPLVVVLHGGPHSVYLASFSKSLAFLSSNGFSLLHVNYRGSLGFGEEALQSLPGKVGSQDVNDVLVAIDHVIDLGLASPSKIAVLGGSHGGFLTTHLIGQAPEKFAAACAKNPVCNLALMVGTSDIPDWCYLEAFGSEGKSIYSEAPSAEDLALFHSKSPISHISKVKTPTLFLLGAKDLRVPISTGLQYARALKEKGVAVKVIVFPNDIHPIDRRRELMEAHSSLWIPRFTNVILAAVPVHPTWMRTIFSSSYRPPTLVGIFEVYTAHINIKPFEYTRPLETAVEISVPYPTRFKTELEESIRGKLLETDIIIIGFAVNIEGHAL
ncbi:hypothetical protein ABKV19_025248 [Rosa sericea]